MWKSNNKGVKEKNSSRLVAELDGEDAQQGGGWQQGGPTFTCDYARKNNWEVRQNAQPRVPAQETKVSKPLVVKTCGGCSGGGNSQSHRRVPWRGPQDPRIHACPLTWELAPERA